MPDNLTLILTALGTLIGSILLTYRSGKQASEAKAASVKTQKDYGDLKVAVDSFLKEINTLQGRLAEQREIYQDQIEKLQNRLIEMNRVLAMKQTMEQQLIDQLAQERARAAKLAEQVQALTKRIRELEQQINFFIQREKAK